MTKSRDGEETGIEDDENKEEEEGWKEEPGKDIEEAEEFCAYRTNWLSLSSVA